MQNNYKLSQDERNERRDVYINIRDAFAEKYSFLGAQASRELLLSAATWNIDKYSNPDHRMRNHVMLAWKAGWLKSTIIRKMQKVLGEDLVTTVGKLTSAVLRGSVSGGKFSPPTPMKSPIIASTEFGQTEFTDELLNTFLALLEEGETNVSLNKIAGLPEGAKSNAEEKYDGIDFIEENEFKLKVDFIFWGATHNPSLLSREALKSRFIVVTPNEPLTGEITYALQNSPPIEKQLNKTDIKAIRRMLNSQQEVATNFSPPKSYCIDYDLSPREARDVESYMAARNWWGLDVSPEIMQEYIKEMKKSRRIADLNPEDRVKGLLFDNPMTYEEIMHETGFRKVEVHDILESIGARVAARNQEKTEWVVRSGDKEVTVQDEEDDTPDWLDEIK